MNQKRLFAVTSICVILALLVGCAAPGATAPGAASSASQPQAKSDLVPVTYTYAGSGVPRDLKQVQDALNKILNEKIHVNLTLEPIDFGAYNEKMQLRLSAGEECDIIFTAPWINSYTNNVANGSLLEL